MTLPVTDPGYCSFCGAENPSWWFSEPGPRSHRKKPDAYLRACSDHRDQAEARWKAATAGLRNRDVRALMPDAPAQGSLFG